MNVSFLLSAVTNKLTIFDLSMKYALQWHNFD